MNTETVPLSSVADLRGGYAFKSQDYRDSGHFVLRTVNISDDGRISRDGAVFISEFHATEYERFQLKEGDTLFVMVGATLGKVGFVRNSALPALLNQNMWVIRTRDSSQTSPRFINYWFQWEVQKTLQWQSGSARGFVRRDDYRSLPFPKIKYSEQKAIAAVLSSLDDKIDLLHLQNQTLESMAETLFRQWFVEEVHEGWEERPLSSIANFLNGLACQKYPPKNDQQKLPVLKIKELSSGISESSDWVTNEVKPEYIVEAGDVIFAWSASLMVKVWDGEKSVLNQHLFKVTSSEFPKWFYLMWCKHHLAEFISISASHATTMGHIKRGDLDAAMAIVPPENELKTMSEKMTPLLDKQIAIAKQIRSLERLRNTLLPKLMSGEVRVAY